MPKLLIHTGIHKTGTTTIQNTFYNNRSALAAQGFFYPLTGLSEAENNWGHHALAYALRQEPSGRAMWQALRAEADQSQADKIVVSSEELSLLPFPTLGALQPYRIIAETFKGYEIQLICYLRPQADMVASLYNHHVKSIGEARGILDFMADIAPRLDYMQYLHVAGSGLGDAAIHVRRFAREWLKGDILEDFAQYIGLDLNAGIKRPKATLNPGLSVQGLHQMIEANTRLADDPERLKRERLQILRRNKAQPFESCNMLETDIQRAITALYHYKNIQIGRRFLRMDGSVFDPSAKPLPRPPAKS